MCGMHPRHVFPSEHTRFTDPRQLFEHMPGINQAKWNDL